MGRRKNNPIEAADNEISKITHRRPKKPHMKRERKPRVRIIFFAK